MKLLDKLPYDALIKVKFVQMIAGALVVGAGILGAYWFTAHAASEEEYAAAEKKKGEIAASLKMYKREIARTPVLMRAVAQLEANLAEKKRQLPMEDELPRLINRVADAGSLLGIRVASFKIGNEIQNKEFYRVIPLSIEISGGYYSTLGFFDSLQHLLHVVNVENLEMESKLEQVVGANEETGEAMFIPVEKITSKIDAVTYAYIEGAEN